MNKLRPLMNLSLDKKKIGKGRKRKGKRGEKYSSSKGSYSIRLFQEGSRSRIRSKDGKNT